MMMFAEPLSVVITPVVVAECEPCMLQHELLSDPVSSSITEEEGIVVIRIGATVSYKAVTVNRVGKPA